MLKLARFIKEFNGIKKGAIKSMPEEYFEKLREEGFVEDYHTERAKDIKEYSKKVVKNRRTK